MNRAVFLKVRWLVGCALLCAAPLTSHASNPPFTITGTTLTAAQGEEIISTFYQGLAGNGGALASQFNASASGYDATFEAQINNLLTGIDFSPTLGAFADAGAGAAKTMPVDYASDFSLFTLSAGGGATVKGIGIGDIKNFNPNETNNVGPNEGAGVNVSLLLGINLGFFHLPQIGFFDFSKLNVYVNGFSYTSPKFGDLSVQANVSSWGIHGQYHLFDSISVAPFGLLRWGGLSVGTGVTVTDLDMTASRAFDNINEEQQFTFQGQTLQLNYGYQGNATVEANTHIVAIPIEVSTSIQLLNFLTLYGGGGFDFNFGSTSAKATSKDPVTLGLQDANGKHLDNIITPTATLALDNLSHGPSIGSLRGFGGAQINIVVVGVFAQANADTAGNFGVNGGVRAFW